MRSYIATKPHQVTENAQVNQNKHIYCRKTMMVLCDLCTESVHVSAEPVDCLGNTCQYCISSQFFLPGDKRFYVLRKFHIRLVILINAHTAPSCLSIIPTEFYHSWNGSCNLQNCRNAELQKRFSIQNFRYQKCHWPDSLNQEDNSKFQHLGQVLYFLLTVKLVFSG